MVWKILSALSIVCLGAASYLAYSNPQSLRAERDREKNAKANYEAALSRQKEAEEAVKDRKAQHEEASKTLATLKTEVEKFTSNAVEKEQAGKLIKANLDQVTQQVASVEKQIAEIGDVEKLLASIENLKKDQLKAQGEVANQEQRLADAKVQVEGLSKQIAALRDAEARGRRGIVAPDFTARVAQYFPAWNFAILSKGNSGGVFANADLEVKRGRNVIAKLKVRNVEQHRSVADVIPGSLAAGDSIQPGDVVVAAATQSAAQPPPAPRPQAPAAAPAANGAAPAPADPFGAAPMSNDPFGAAPAPAGAPAMNNDPFGAAPAPAPAGAPAMGNDPFGSAPAPATPAPAPAGGAPAMDGDPFSMAPAPAPAAGTPAAPSTADPFAPAPKP